MNAVPSSSPQAEPPPSSVRLPVNPLPPSAATQETSVAGGARKLSRWEDLEELWLPEDRNLSHSGINE
ncbi:MAG: hypothetical protein RL514_1704 [Verrucomicrobiota bacterium]|jgi:hypothetical protein